MQIVINMPDSTTKEMLENYENESMFDEVLRDALKQAIILPKGHGRLIDADKLMTDINTWCDCEKGTCLLKDTLTIIEADKER